MAQPVTTIHTTSDFRKAFLRVPKNIQEAAIKQDQLFRNNPFGANLKTHALKDELKGFHAYSVTKDYHISFRFITPTEVIYYDIGTHSIYTP